MYFFLKSKKTGLFFGGGNIWEADIKYALKLKKHNVYRFLLKFYLDRVFDEHEFQKVVFLSTLHG